MPILFLNKKNCLPFKLNRKLRKMFLSSRRESNPQPSDLRWDALTIELQGLGWQREGHDVYRFARATHVLLNSSLDMSIYLINEYICMKDDLQLGKLSPGSSMVRERLTGHQKVSSSIPVWGSETFFWVCDKAWVANNFPLIYQAASHPSSKSYSCEMRQH